MSNIFSRVYSLFITFFYCIFILYLMAKLLCRHGKSPKGICSGAFFENQIKYSIFLSSFIWKISYTLSRISRKSSDVRSLSFGSVTFMMLLTLPGLADMITMRSAGKIASSISCVTNTTVLSVSCAIFRTSF